MHFLKLFSCIFFLSVSLLNSKAILIGSGVRYVKGETVFESVRIPEDYSLTRNYASGSRLIYENKNPELNLSFQLLTEKQSITLNGNSSFGYRQSGQAVDDDFYTNRSTERRNWGFYDPIGYFGRLPKVDSPYRYSGQDSTFVISKGNNEVQTSRFSLEHKFYFDKANPDPWKESFGMFFITSIQYDFVKYKVSDSVSYDPFYRNAVYLGGLNASYTNNILQGGLGLGYVHSFNNWVIEGFIQVKKGEIHSLDFHFLRNLRFIETYQSYGYLHHLSVGYKITPDWLLKLEIDQNRIFAAGTLKVESGASLNQAISLKLLGSPQGINMGIKETILAFSFIRKFDL